MKKFNTLFVAILALLGGCASNNQEYQSPALSNVIKIVPDPEGVIQIPPPLTSTIKKVSPIESKLPIQKSPSIWVLHSGKTIGHDLSTWGEKAGWKVIWTMSKDWVTPSTTQFHGDFQEAATEVITTLAANGAFVHAQFYVGNKTMVVTGAGVAPQ